LYGGYFNLYEIKEGGKKMDLATIWFSLWGLLWAIYFITDGFDLGIGILLPLLGKDDEQKRIIYNAIGPLWNGNEVWLITAGGVTFAAFPTLYSVMFSSFYSALMLILFALIVRGVAIEFRSEAEGSRGRKIWDICLFSGSLLPAILFGVAFANIFRGIPLDKNGIYHGTLFTLLNPYALLGGLLFLSLFIVHGAIWLAIKSEGELHDRAVRTAHQMWPVLLVTAVIFLVASKFATELYGNYLDHPALFLVILITALALLAVKIFLRRKNYWKAWFSSALTILGTTFFGIIGLYPNMLPSTLNHQYNLTAHNASSSQMTLKIMLIVAVIFVPAVLAYQIWAYNLFKGKIAEEEI
jgi:cytochrome d ubiquinol oxidase subunit II